MNKKLIRLFPSKYPVENIGYEIYPLMSLNCKIKIIYTSHIYIARALQKNIKINLINICFLILKKMMMMIIIMI
jgi:hypothetical protein